MGAMVNHPQHIAGQVASTQYHFLVLIGKLRLVHWESQKLEGPGLKNPLLSYLKVQLITLALAVAASPWAPGYCVSTLSRPVSTEILYFAYVLHLDYT